MMNTQRLFIIPLFVISLASCNESVSWKDYSPSSVPVEKYIPITKRGYPVPFEESEKISNQLHLYPIENGFDSFQLRISIRDSSYSLKNATGYKEYDIGYMITISCNKHSVWKASCTRYNVSSVDSGVRLNARPSVKYIAPKKWSDVARKIGDLSIGSWLGANAFAYDDYMVGHTENIIDVEYASITQWRRMKYVSPSAVTCNLPECKKVEALLNILIEDFGLVKFKKFL